MSERISKPEDTMEKLVKATMASQKNNMAMIRNIEIQMGQIANK